MNKVFDLKNLQPWSWVEGITNLKHNPTLEDVKQSRGEFIGYISSSEELHLFRDRLGARNLYFSHKNWLVFMSTDLWWVVFNCGWKPEVDPETLKEYIDYQVPLSPLHTLYRNVYRVPPATIINFSKSGMKQERYWKLSFDRQERFSPKYLLDLIVDAVEFRKKLLPNCYTSYISGGIDSSTITTLLQPREALAGFYKDEEYSELNYITALREENKLNKFFCVEITEKKFHQYMTHLPEILPDPMGGLGVIPQTIVAMEAFKRGYHYAFTGEGGDEIFCGYNWNTLIFTLADAARGLLRDRYMVRYEPMVQRILKDGFLPLVASLIAKSDNPDPSPVAKIWDKNQSVENNILKINIEIGLPAILTVDRCVGKFSSVIPVSPFIDHHIIEYVVSTDPLERTRIPKYLLREAMKGILPEKIRTRFDKMGFPVPFEKWSWPMVEPLLESLRKRGLIEVSGNHQTMDRKAWAFCNLELICRKLDEGRQTCES